VALPLVEAAPAKDGSSDQVAVVIRGAAVVCIPRLRYGTDDDALDTFPVEALVRYRESTSGDVPIPRQAWCAIDGRRMEESFALARRLVQADTEEEAKRDAIKAADSGSSGPPDASRQGSGGSLDDLDLDDALSSTLTDVIGPVASAGAGASAMASGSNESPLAERALLEASSQSMSLYEAQQLAGIRKGSHAKHPLLQAPASGSADDESPIHHAIGEWNADALKQAADLCYSPRALLLAASTLAQ